MQTEDSSRQIRNYVRAHLGRPNLKTDEVFRSGPEMSIKEGCVGEDGWEVWKVWAGPWAQS